METQVARTHERTNEPAQTERRPVRTCIACRGEGSRGELFRLVQGPDGALAFDMRARMPGRGAWVHPTRKCLTDAAKRHAAERSLTVSHVDADGMVAGVVSALTRKADSLILIASRKRAIAIGAEATADALERGRGVLVVVAKDAGDVKRAVTRDAAQPPARDAGRAEMARGVCEYGTKESWGRMFGRGEVAVFAVTDPGIAAEISTTVDCLAGLEDG